MGGLPLHPAVVHLPIGLAVLAPVLAVLGVIAVLRGRSPRSLWGMLVLVQGLVVAGALLAQRTGHADEDRVERFAPEAAVELHEERGELFVWVAVAGLVTAVAAVAVPAGTGALVAALVAATASVAIACAAFWVGHSGGELVYRHRAADAWATPASDVRHGRMTPTTD